MDKSEILVICSDDGVCGLIRGALSDRGFQVTVASTAGEGLEMLKGGAPGLVLLDSNMGDAGGVDLRAGLSKKNIPFAVISSGEAEPGGKPVKPGTEGLIARPPEPEAVLRIAEKVFSAQGEGPAPPPEKGLKRILEKIKEKLPGGSGKNPPSAQGKSQTAVRAKTADACPGEEKSSISVKFIAAVIAFIMVGGVLYRARSAVNTADNSLRKGNYSSAIGQYSGALAITPWSGRAKDGLRKTESLIQAEKAELLGGREKLARDLTEYAERLKLKTERLSELDEKIEKLEGALEIAGEAEAEFRAKSEEFEKEAASAALRNDELSAENAKLAGELESVKEEIKKSPYKSELSEEEKLELKKEILSLRDEAKNLRRRVGELEPDAMRVRAVEEMKQDAMEERRRLLSERLDFMNLKEKRALIEERDGAPHRAKDEMALEEIPSEADISSALRYIEAGEYDAASGLLAGILAREPGNENVRRLLGTVILAGTAADVGGNRPGNPGNKNETPSLKRALELISEREYEKAEKMLSGILRENPSDITAGELIMRVRVLKGINNR